MAKLLIEIFTEEIPYSLQTQILEDLENLFPKLFAKYNINVIKLETQATPNRVAVCVHELPNTIPDQITEIKGPKINAPSRALEGFLKTHKTSKAECIIKETPKGSFYFYNIVNKGGDIVKFLPQIITEVLSKVTFKKSMAWNHSKVEWARPIRSLLGLVEKNNTCYKLSFAFAGIEATNKISTHRVLGKQNIIIKSIADYYKTLANNFVVLEADKRIEIITEELNKIIKKNNFKQEMDSALLNEIAYLVEYPVVLQGVIPELYISLPQELLVNIIVKHQRYIPFYKQDDSLANIIVIVANLKAKDNGKEILKGNLKVLNSRLTDGLFFYNNDLKTSLSQKAEKLKNITFFEGAGTLYQKSQRVARLFQTIFQEEQNYLCSIYKADLVSEVIIEIPELQGIMGYYYALHSNPKGKEIATAILEHYKPISVNDSLPNTLLGGKLALLDKLDTLIELFALGKIPTGSKDPYALRRAALGVIKIINHFKLDLNLQNILKPNLQEFILDRLGIYLKLANYNVEAIQSVINQQQIVGANNKVATSKTDANIKTFNIYKIFQHVVALDALLKTKEGEDVLQIRVRLQNIVASQNNYQIVKIQEKLLQEPVEQKLYQEILKLNKLELFKLKGIKQNNNSNLQQAIKVIAKIQPLLNEFLNTIVINKSPTADIKNNRISLLNNLLHYIEIII